MLSIKLKFVKYANNYKVQKFMVNADALGTKLEFNVLDLVQFLDGVHDAWLSETGSALDVHLKTDLVIVPSHNQESALCVQIKSTQEQADNHLSLESVAFEGRKYRVAPVVIKGTPSSMLEQLSIATGLDVNSDVQKAVVELAKFKAAGLSKISASIFSPVVRRAAIVLQIARYENNEFVL